MGFAPVVDGEACEDGLPGLRYAMNGDLSAITVYDANGFIAGVQLAVSTSICILDLIETLLKSGCI